MSLPQLSNGLPNKKSHINFYRLLKELNAIPTPVGKVLSSLSFPFGATMDREAGMSAHSQH